MTVTRTQQRTSAASRTWRDRLRERWSELQLVVAVLVIAGAGAWLAHRWQVPPHCDVGIEADLGCTRGFESREQDNYGTFRWTDDSAAIHFSGAGYGATQIVEVVLAAPRSPEAEPVVASLSIGDQQLSFTPDAVPRRYQLFVPAQALSGDSTTIQLDSTTFAPSSSRHLGLVVYEAIMRPASGNTTTIPGMFVLLMVSTIGLSTLAVVRHLQSTSTTPWLRARWLTLLCAIISIGATVPLIAIWPDRTIPFFPALIPLLGLTTFLTIRSQAFVLLLFPPVWLALIGNGLIDGAIVFGMVPRPWIAACVMAQAALTIWTIWQATSDKRDHPWVKSGSAPTLAALLIVTFAVRIIAQALRLLAGRGASDPDTELFYAYGRATIELGTPVVEYPSGALLPWALLALPDSRELFALLLPLLNLACDMAIVWGIWLLGRHSTTNSTTHAATAKVGTMFALCYALSPLLLPFWYSKYDSLPAALLVLGMAAFVLQRPGWAGVALGLGGAVKWVPWLAAPFLVWALLRPATQNKPQWRGIGWFIGGFVGTIVACSLPFALHNLENFLMPYTLQGGRSMIGESIWFPLALLFDPGLLNDLPAPWSSVPDAAIPNAVMVGVQVITLGTLALLQMTLPTTPERTMVLASLAAISFLLLNRVFSPQYVLILSAGILAAAAAIRVNQVRTVVGCVAIMQAMNLLIWPNLVPYWLITSIVMFSCGVFLTVILIVWAVRNDLSWRRTPYAFDEAAPAKER
ncbi:MAG: DUF2029 domain-containing protein [Chloroflexi bacterium AL-W]|nr:DUF2029 domain-containing protein [Chloroflexi bacterium AL-N1]NOK69252.1 DUF2029 domain-containing protein [Chloroflexi bacterium AL-N10]NOK76313.1 DUF2029 domain-containing protein [Chloroflexi bacterium AL-N5]NOK83430.1 DUF2029 domain-containing protein [Chloroflexi bacterium AL-W]NOK91090.1 DUF2029 domain-containing protein [Chloroflexi bacterium AL-N15]